MKQLQLLIVNGLSIGDEIAKRVLQTLCATAHANRMQTNDLSECMYGIGAIIANIKNRLPLGYSCASNKISRLFSFTGDVIHCACNTVLDQKAVKVAKPEEACRFLVGGKWPDNESQWSCLHCSRNCVDGPTSNVVNHMKNVGALPFLRVEEGGV